MSDDTVDTADGRVIPPPDAKAFAIDLQRAFTNAVMSMHSVSQFGQTYLHEGIASLACRCHAAEAEVRRQAEEIASLRERVAELEADSTPPDCPSCHGSGWVTIRADRVTVAGGECKCVGGLNWRNP